MQSTWTVLFVAVFKEDLICDKLQIHLKIYETLGIYVDNTLSYVDDKLSYHKKGRFRGCFWLQCLNKVISTVGESMGKTET